MAGASNHVDRGGPGGARFAWLSLFFAAWITGGVVFVYWASGRGLVQDVGLSPYHVPAYLGLLALAALCLSLVIRAVRQGRSWREAFPRGYGILGAGLLVGLAVPIVDVAWREGIAPIGTGIEGFLAPSRVLLSIAIVLIAIGPLRLARRSQDASVGRWAPVVSAGLILGVLGFFSGFQPALFPWLERPPQVPQGNTEIWDMNADGAQQTRLIEANDVSSASYPSWSPDQTKLAYQLWTLGQDGRLDADVWVAEADGTGRRRLVGGPGWQWIAYWSPDGAWIVYTQEAEGGPGMAAGPAAPAVGVGPPGPGFGPAITVRSHAALWRTRADGSGSPQRLTDGLADDRAAVYSPDGTRLVFDSLRDGNTQIYVMNADGTDPVRLTHDSGEDWAAAWSPDGKHIAFHSYVTGTWQINVMAADGSELTRLSNDNGNDQYPAWSPDGSRIAFNRDGEIWSMAANGSDRQNLSRSPGASTSVGTAAWGRDGRIVYTRAEDPPAASQPWVRDDLGAAGLLLEAMLIAIVALVVIWIVPPFGAFTLVMGLAMVIAASVFEQWRFVPAALAGGLIVDLLVHLAPAHLKAHVAGAASAAVFVLGAGVTVAATTGLALTPTLLLGVAFAPAALAWGLAGALGRPADGTEGRPAA